MEIYHGKSTWWFASSNRIQNGLQEATFTFGKKWHDEWKNVNPFVHTENNNIHTAGTSVNTYIQRNMIYFYNEKFYKENVFNENFSVILHFWKDQYISLKYDG